MQLPLLPLPSRHHTLCVSKDYDSGILPVILSPWWVLAILVPGYAEGNCGNAAYEHALERPRIHGC